LRGLVETFSIIQDSIRVHCDSQSAIHLAKDHRYYKRTKHINVRHHKIRQWVLDDKVINLVKISTKNNLADIMTKTIPVEKFRASLTSSRFSKGKVVNRLLGGSHMKSQKGGRKEGKGSRSQFLRRDSMNMSQCGDC